MTEEATPWAEMLKDGIRLGLMPEVFWRLSVAEWRMLSGGAGGAALGRDGLERLVRDWPDEGGTT